MPSSSLIKTALNNAVADGIYNELTSGYAKYYYFLGRTLTWEDELNPPLPIDSIDYENKTRNEMITIKQIKATDLSYVIRRIDWASGTIYDTYDDQYSTEVQGVNLISGGNSFSAAPYIYIGSTDAQMWEAGYAYTNGELIKAGSNYYIVTNTGISGTVMPTTVTLQNVSFLDGTVSLTSVSVFDGSGSGARAESTILDGQIIDISLISRGTGYTSLPSCIIVGGGGANAMAEAVITIGNNGAQKLEDAEFYVVTDEFNVYKCLDNNLKSPSTVKPIGTTVEPVVLADGYMWKFMYSVPVALRNKFVTGDYIPIVSALRNQFYSNGTLQTIRLDERGTGYTSGSIIVQGDGHSAADPVYLTNPVLAAGGSEYDGSVTLNVDPPYNGVSSWIPNQNAIVGQKLIYENNVYNVAVSGTTSSSDGPVHRFGVVQNGFAQLQYVGTIPSGEAVVTDGVITSIQFYAMLRFITMNNGGSGYTNVPVVTITGDGTGAQGIAVLQNGAVIRIIVTDPGTGFTDVPTVTIGTEWTSEGTVSVNDQIFYSNRLYTVTAGGTLGTSAPIHITGSASNGGVTLEYAGIAATATAYLKYGAGYNSQPAVTIGGSETGGGAQIYFSSVKSEGRLVPLFENEQLVGIQIDDEGVGYSYANLTVQGTGTGAKVSADLSPGDVNTLQANVELLTVDGRIMAYSVISGGWGYGSASVVITGDGAGATAHAIIENGSIKKIVVDSYGQNYRWATVSIIGNGFGAKVRAIIGPFGGHGKEAIKNLFGRTLMFYSNMSQDKNQGFDVNNDYRQLGIIKSPRQYANTHNLTSIYASACWVVAGTINTTLFPADALLTRSSDGSRFRIVTNNGSAALLQSLDNAEPMIGQVLINGGGDLFSISAVTPPTIDKYSGYLMFIDNKAAFTPTADQTVTLRTVIKF
jgi:hypothetical protein